MPKVSDGQLALGLAAAFAIWLFGILPFLYGPPPRFAETSSSSQSHADQAGQQPAAKPDGSVTAPFFIRIPKTAKEEAEDASDRHEKSSTDRWLMIFTGAVALFTLLLVRATVMLYRAGERQLALAQSSSERQLRAYVYIEKTPITADGDIFAVVFYVKNFGQTPAHNVTVEYAFEVVDCVDKKPKDIPVATESVSLGSIAPLTDFYELDHKLTGVSLLSIQSGDKAIYLTGSITYDTVFTQGRVTNFQYLVGGKIGWHGDTEMSADDEGNDAT
jgi:hypothetical protein